jgi:16S rRNA (cytosine967-C5)-methyltransferase
MVDILIKTPKKPKPSATSAVKVGGIKRVPDAAGQPARQLALDALIAVQRRNRSLEDALTEEANYPLEARDRGFTRALVTTCLRRRGEIASVLGQLVPKPLPKSAGPAPEILSLLVAELLFMKVPAHAAVSSAVNIAASDRNAQAFRGLINAVGRKLAAHGDQLLDPAKAGRLNTPDWLYASWVNAYGADVALAIAQAHLGEAPLDISVKRNPAIWAEKLEAEILPTGTLRRWGGGRVEALEGFHDGEWWVQDAAAALPPHLFGPVAGRRVLDLCAAPGGKTLSLAQAGAKVTAIDRTANRLARLKENLKRTKLDAQIIEADGTLYHADQPFDFILVDAPCSSTGTIRRHPDVAWAKTPEDVASLVRLQDRLLDQAVQNLAPGGVLIFSTCSIQPQEGPERIERLLAQHPSLTRKPITAGDVFGLDEIVTPAGDLRALPCHLARSGGLDGFFAGRLTRKLED